MTSGTTTPRVRAPAAVEPGTEEDVVQLGPGEARRVPELARQVGERPGGAHDHVRAQQPEGRPVDRLEVVGLLEPDVGDDPGRERQARHEQAEEGHHLAQEPAAASAGRGNTTAKWANVTGTSAAVAQSTRTTTRTTTGSPRLRRTPTSVPHTARVVANAANHRLTDAAGVPQPHHDRQRHLDQRDQEEPDDGRHGGVAARLSRRPGGRG